MSETQDIRRALEKRLEIIQDTSLNPPIAWEGISFDPSLETTWLRTKTEFVERQPAGVGADADLLRTGLFFINVYGKADVGPATVDSLADEVMDLFPYGLTLTENGKNVKIRYTERVGGIYDAPWYYVPVTVTWYVFI